MVGKGTEYGSLVSSPTTVAPARNVTLLTPALSAAVVLIVAPLALPAFANQTLVRIGVYAVAMLGLNIVMGYTGQVNLGQIFFVGLGAYVTAYGVNHRWNILLVFAAACAVAGVVGLLVALAAARLAGLAIAMVTIALPIVGVPLAKRLTLVTGAGAHKVWEKGELAQSFFPRHKVGAVDGSLGVQWHLGEAWRLEVGAEYRRYYYAMRPEPGDRFIVGGAVDQYLSGTISMGFELR